MSTILSNCEIELSKQLGDYWAGTTTGAGSSTTVVDTALKAKANDWITDDAYDHITSATCLDEERKIPALDNTTGTLTVLAHSGTGPGISATYRVHRLFNASDKRIALIYAARHSFPYLFEEIWDESLVCGNWLKDGSFERWTTSTNLTDWTDTTVTTTQNTSASYLRHSLTSCRLDTAAGTLSQAITNFGDLQFLRGKSVTFTCQGWCDTASCLRLSINDGTTQTYSEYHTGDDAWTEDNPRNDSFYVTQYIASNATQVTFTIHHGVAAATSYVDDARVISDYRGRLNIGYLWLAQNRPHQVYIEPTYYSQEEDWIKITDYKVSQDGYLYIPTIYPSDYRLRIRGIGYLDFLVSGVSSTSWSATIDIESPQLDILVAEAAIYLCNQMVLPNYTSGESDRWARALAYWQNELNDRRMKYGMKSPAATLHWGMP